MPPDPLAASGGLGRLATDFFIRGPLGRGRTHSNIIDRAKPDELSVASSTSSESPFDARPCDLIGTEEQRIAPRRWVDHANSIVVGKELKCLYYRWR